MAVVTLDGNPVHFTRNNVTTNLPALVLIHGAGGSSRDWPYQWQQTATVPASKPRWITDYPLYLLDLPGHGRSQPPARTSIADYAADVVAFSQVVGIRRAVYVGHSMGGAIALTIGLMKPANLAGLVVLGSGPRMPVSDAILDGLRTDFAQTVSLIQKFSWRKEARSVYREVATQHMLAAGPEVVYGDFAACHAFDIGEQIGEISAPTLVVGSTSDRMMPLAQSETLAAGISSAQLAVIEDGGHFMMTEKTNEVNAALLGFMKQLSAQ